jgi:transposase
MPGPYSLDLRKRVLAACEEGTLTRAEIAQVYQIAESTLYEWLQLWRETQSLSPLPHGGGRTSELRPPVLEEMFAACNDRTLEEYATGYEERTGRRYSLSTICRALGSLQLRRKKNAPSQRAAQARDRHRAGGLPG